MKTAIWICMLVFLGGYYSLQAQQIPGFNRPDEDDEEFGSVSSNDTVVRRKFEYKYLETTDLKTTGSDLDTNLITVHLPESYYRQGFLPGSLGSEYAARYTPLYAMKNDVGLDRGLFSHQDILYGPVRKHIVDVSRALWNIHYMKGNAINSSYLNVGFYRKFHRNILLNFTYRDTSDDGWLGTQPNESGLMDIKIAQQSNLGRRKSYVQYHRADISETQSRGVVNNILENGEVADKITAIEVGNLLYFKDSIPEAGTPNLLTRLVWHQKEYQFVDPNVSDSEELYYQTGISEDTLLFRSRWQGIEIKNTYHHDWRGWQWASNLDLRLSSFRQNAIEDRFQEIILGLKARRFLPQRHMSLLASLQAGLLSSSGDLSMDVEWQWDPNSNNEYSAGLRISRLRPDLVFRQAMVNSQITWQMMLPATQQFSLKGSYAYNPWNIQLDFNWEYLKDYILFDENARPLVNESAIHIWQVVVEKKINLGPFRSTHRAAWQSINASRILRPEIQYHGKIFFQLSLFKEKMDLAVGSDIYFIPSFTLPAYQPVLGVFYNDFITATSGNVLLINPFINFQVGKLLAFLRVTNASSRLSNQRVYMVKDYAIFDYRIGFGIKWNLLD